MKSAGLKILLFAVVAMVMYSFTYLNDGGIKGTVAPKEAVSAVYAIKGTDTFASSYVEGSFMFASLKKGNYTLLFKGVEPYKDTILSNIEVADSVVTDVGEIKMQP